MLRLLGDLHDAFDAQQIGPEILLQRFEQQPQRLARDRVVAHEAERGDVAVVQTVMLVMRVVVIGRVAAMRVRVMMRLVLLRIGGGIEPSAGVGLGVGGVEAAGAQEFAAIECRVTDARDLRRGIEPPQSRGERGLVGLRLGRIDEIELGDEDMVGERDLPHRLDMLIERPRPVHRIERRHHRADAIEPGERRVGEEGLDQRRGIGEPRGLDHDMIETRNRAVLAGVIEIVERGDEVAEHGAAQAAILQHHDGVVALRREQMIEADLAELVDHHRSVRHRRTAQRAV